MILDLKPFNVVSNAGFLRRMQQYHPQYEVPTSKFFSEFMDRIHEKIENRVKDTISEHDPKTVTISLDAWSSQHHGYLGVNAHYIHEFKRRKFNLACKKFDDAHTSENIWAKLSEVLDNFKLKDLIYLALRDAANNIKACFYTEECDIEAIDDILHSLQTVIGHNIITKCTL